MSDKMDITDMSDRELSLIVFNDEYLYKLRNRPRLLREAINESYTYNCEQWLELYHDIHEDLDSNELEEENYYK